MSTTPNGSGPELEKFPDAPPSIEVNAPEEVPHAGLRSLDHCTYFQSLLRTCAEILFETRRPTVVLRSPSGIAASTLACIW